MKDLKKYQDRIIGRPIVLNRQRLEIREGKEYAEVVFFGDVHFGNPSCDIERAKTMLEYCFEKKVYVFLMGDLMEAGLKTSVGASMYEQVLNPQEQLEKIVEMLEPLAKAKLILGALEGNHELRIMKNSGIKITKIICRLLNISYLNSAAWNLWYVGNQSYSVYALHGSSGSRFIYTKLKALVDISHSFNADLMAMGHIHEIGDASQLVQEVDRQYKVVVEKKKFLVLTGSYLKYEKSYVQEKGYPISKMGSPKVKFFAKKKDIHISA